MTPYPKAIEQAMRKFYGTLSEKDRRRYAAIEAQKLGHGGITYIARVLGCAHGTISSGINELNELPDACGYDASIRRSGGGRKRYVEEHPAIDAAFLDVLKDHTAGDPMRENVRWTNLTQREIVERLQADHDIQVSEVVVKQLLKKHEYRRRKAKKKSL